MTRLLPDSSVGKLDYFERHPVRVASSLNALGLVLWSTVKYPGKIEEMKVLGPAESSAATGEENGSEGGSEGEK